MLPLLKLVLTHTFTHSPSASPDSVSSLTVPPLQLLFLLLRLLLVRTAAIVVIINAAINTTMIDHHHRLFITSELLSLLQYRHSSLIFLSCVCLIFVSLFLSPSVL